MTVKTKTQQAIDYLTANPKATPYEAAKAIGLATSVLYRALNARNRERCPTCGRYK